MSVCDIIGKEELFNGGNFNSLHLYNILFSFNVICVCNFSGNILILYKFNIALFEVYFIIFLQFPFHAAAYFLMFLCYSAVYYY